MYAHPKPPTRFRRAFAKLPWQVRAALIAARIALREKSRVSVERGRGQQLGSFERRVLSQNGEDGIIAYIFSEIGFRSRFFCEFGFSIAECNSLLLARQQNFSGVWIDANSETCKVGLLVSKLLRWRGINVINEHVTRENINSIIGTLAADDHIDLLSIDIDGNDYWILEVLDRVRPRVLVAEYNAIFGPDRSVTIPYHDGFDRYAYDMDGFYFGASLSALEQLARRKGYRLLGTERSGTNAFFVDANIQAPNLATTTSAQCWRPMDYWVRRGRTMDECFDRIKQLPLVAV